jgi:hypothetical protein
VSSLRIVWCEQSNGRYFYLSSFSAIAGDSDESEESDYNVRDEDENTKTTQPPKLKSKPH